MQVNVKRSKSKCLPAVDCVNVQSLQEFIYCKIPSNKWFELFDANENKRKIYMNIMWPLHILQQTRVSYSVG